MQEEVRNKGSYKGWSKSDRNRSYILTNKAKKLGWLKPQDKCERCGQTEGKIHSHNSNYDVTLKILPICFSRVPVSITTEERVAINAVLEVLCFRCHLKLHRDERNANPLVFTK